jgi:hypothetical protein
MNSILDGHHGAFGRTSSWYFAAWHLHIIDRGQRCLDNMERVEQTLARQHPAIVVDLQRANARGQFDQTGEPGVENRLRQQMHPHPKTDIKRHRAIFDQKIVVAGTAIHHWNRS